MSINLVTSNTRFHLLLQLLMFVFSLCFQFKTILIGVLVADTAMAFAVDRLCSLLFGSVRKSDIVSEY